MGDQNNKSQNQAAEESNDQKGQDVQVKGGQAFRNEQYKSREDSMNQKNQSSESQDQEQGQSQEMGESSDLGDKSQNSGNKHEE